MSEAMLLTFELLNAAGNGGVPGVATVWSELLPGRGHGVA